MSLMMDEILEQPRALARTFKAERAHAAELNIMAPNKPILEAVGTATHVQ